MLNLCVLRFLVGLMGIVYRLPNSVKYRFLGKFGSHNSIYTFKNYFATVFSIISFQFLANKWYPNTPVMFEKVCVVVIRRLGYKKKLTLK